MFQNVNPVIINVVLVLTKILIVFHALRIAEISIIIVNAKMDFMKINKKNYVNLVNILVLIAKLNIFVYLVFNFKMKSKIAESLFLVAIVLKDFMKIWKLECVNVKLIYIKKYIIVLIYFKLKECHSRCS